MIWVLIATFMAGATIGFLAMALFIGLRDDIDPYADEFREGN